MILIIFLIISGKTWEKTNEKFSNESIIIDGSEIGIPDLVLDKQRPESLSILSLISGPPKKIPFIIETQEDSYKINLPSFRDFAFSGRGLVIAGSGNSYRYLTGIYTNVYLIRKVHNSNIPIEIFYVGLEEEFPKDIKSKLLELEGISIINLLDKLEIGPGLSVQDLRGYQTKPLACLCSSFSEIVLMDADAISFIDPIYLFSIKGYNQGMVLFKDYVKCLKFVSEKFINDIGIGSDNFCRKTGNFEIDSSCIVLDKEKAWEALYTICFINVKSDQYYRHKGQEIKYDIYGQVVQDNVSPS